MTHKKYFALALTAMAFSLTACGSTGSATADTSSDTSVSESAVVDGSVVTSSYEEGTAAAELADLFNGGFHLGSSGSDENGTKVYFYNDDHTEFREAICTMTDEQCSTYFNIDWMAEDYDQQCFDVLASCEDLTVITPDLPDMTEYEAYIGKTIGEMEDAGFDFAAYDKDEDGNMVIDLYAYTDEGDAYTLRVTPDIAEDDDTIYDDETIGTLTIKNIVFWNFS